MRNRRKAMSRSTAAALAVVVVVGLVVGYAALTLLFPAEGAGTVTSTGTSTTTVLQTTSVTVSTSLPEGRWKPDGAIEDNEYAHKLELADGKYFVHWGNDNEYLHMALEGETNGWLSIGFEPTSGMQDADMIFGWAKDGEATVLDLYSQGPTGPHPPDTQLGGTNDILEHGGKEENGRTVVEFKRRLDTRDKYDKAFTRGQTIRIIWAMADVDEFTTKHDIARGSAELTLD